jgi:hypothetical protein
MWDDAFAKQLRERMKQTMSTTIATSNGSLQARTVGFMLAHEQFPVRELVEFGLSRGNPARSLSGSAARTGLQGLALRHRSRCSHFGDERSLCERRHNREHPFGPKGSGEVIDFYGNDVLPRLGRSMR